MKSTKKEVKLRFTKAEEVARKREKETLHCRKKDKNSEFPSREKVKQLNEG